MYYVYVIYSKKLKKRYVGSTENVERRIREHNNGKNRFTKGGIPWIKIYLEEYESRSEAMQRESYLKSGVGRRYLDNVVKIDDI